MCIPEKGGLPVNLNDETATTIVGSKELMGNDRKCILRIISHNAKRIATGGDGLRPTNTAKGAVLRKQ